MDEKYVMNTKLAALKICRLEEKQRQQVLSDMGPSAERILVEISELNQIFPQLHQLTAKQWNKLWGELTAQPLDINGWDMISNKLNLLKQSNSTYPELLHSLLVEKIKAAGK